MVSEDKINEAVNKNKLEKYGITKKSIYSFVSVLACLVLIVAVSIAQVGFNKEFYKDVNYWINLAILAALSIFGMLTGQQIGDDVNRNNPKGRFRNSLSKYSTKYNDVDNKKLFSYFEDWLEFFRERKLQKKIKDILRENGVHQLEVLDLDVLELDNLKQSWKKDWTGTNKYDKYYNEEKDESITYFMSYSEEQIQLIKDCLRGKVKVSKLPSSFFTDAINAYEKDMWESAAHSNAKKNAYLSLNTTYKLVGLIAFSFIMSGLEPAMDGDASAQQIFLSLASRLFTLATSIVWGMYIGMELVKIDNAYLDYKVRMLSLYEEEYDLGIFKPMTIEERAYEYYKFTHKFEFDKKGDALNERQESTVLD